MPSSPESTELALQICFGVFGIIGTVATLASLHHRDSLGCILIRRWLPMPETDHGDDIEQALGSYEDVTQPIHADPIERRTTLPPAYESSIPGSADALVSHPRQHKTTSLHTAESSP